MSRLAMMLLSPAKARFLAQTTSPLYKPAIVQRNTVFNYDAGIDSSTLHPHRS